MVPFFVICYSQILLLILFSTNWFCFLSLLDNWVFWIFFLRNLFLILSYSFGLKFLGSHFFCDIFLLFSFPVFYHFLKNYLPCLRCLKQPTCRLSLHLKHLRLTHKVSFWTFKRCIGWAGRTICSGHKWCGPSWKEKGSWAIWLENDLIRVTQSFTLRMRRIWW